MTVWRNVELTADSFQEFLEAFITDEEGRNTITSLHLHNVSFGNKMTPSNNRRRNERMANNLIGPPQLCKISIDLCSLDVQAVAVMGPALRAILHSTNSARTFGITNSKISCEFVDLLKSLLEHRNCSLTSFHLQNITMEEECKMNELLLSLHNGPDLNVLHLEKCGLGIAHSSHLAALIKAQKNLNSLNISKNNLDDSALSILLGGGIANHPTLSSLVLSENPIGDEGAISLSKMLASTDCTTLKALCLLECEIWDRGCNAMVRGMPRFRYLKELFVDGNWEEHLDIIVKSLRHNMVLTKLWMPRHVPMTTRSDDEDPTDYSWIQIQYYLRLNRAERKVLLNAPISSSTWVYTFAKGSTDVDLIFYLLRARPEVANFHRLDENEGTLVCG